MSYAVIRTDLMTGTDVNGALVSFKYMGAAGTTAEALENGCVVKIENLMEGERELWLGTDVAADTDLDHVVIAAGVEVMYDERKRNLDEYINEKGKAIRGYRLHKNQDYFGLTKEAFAEGSALAKGNIVELAAGTKLKAVASATTGATKVGKIVAVEKAGRYEYYVVHVE